MSGIVSLLFCGITMAHYSTANMSQSAIQTTKSIFSVTAFMADNFVFTYMGTTIFARTDFSYKPLYIFFAFVRRERKEKGKVREEAGLDHI